MHKNKLVRATQFFCLNFLLANSTNKPCGVWAVGLGGVGVTKRERGKYRKFLPFPLWDKIFSKEDSIESFIEYDIEEYLNSKSFKKVMKLYSNKENQAR